MRCDGIDIVTHDALRINVGVNHKIVKVVLKSVHNTMCLKQNISWKVKSRRMELTQINLLQLP